MIGKRHASIEQKGTLLHARRGIQERLNHDPQTGSNCVLCIQDVLSAMFLILMSWPIPGGYSA
jgi:hypothetical protein